MAVALGLWRPMIAEELPKMLMAATPDGMQINLELKSGAGFHLEASLDNMEWSHLTEGIASEGSASFLDSYSFQFPNRFYRFCQYDHPANDNFDSAEELIGDSASVKGANYCATAELQEPQHSYLNPGGKSVWYRWKAESDSHVVIETFDSYFDTMIAIYSGKNLPSLKEITRGVFSSKLATFEASAGEAYYIALDGAGGQAGAFQLNLKTSPLNPSVPDQLQGTVIDLVDFQNPWDNSSMQFIISPKGDRWELHRNHKSFLEGKVKKAKLEQKRWTIAVAADRGEESEEEIEFSFQFNGSNGGEFSASSAIFQSKGKFKNFHYLQNGFAPATLEEQLLTTVRTYTSTGPVGQAHYYNFTKKRFHDANNEEHAIGFYSYTADGNDAVLITDYTGPADFIGDHHEIHLHFNTPSEGEFTSVYRRNDGVNINMDGTFELN
ncbi:MAG: hypothetical protein ACO1QB_01465 [Verrucomicrobiales bacterium]